MITFLEFMANRQNTQMVAESFDDKTIEKACKLIKTILKEHITNKVLEMPGFVQNKIASETVYSKQYLVTDINNVTITSVFEINWKQAGEKFDAYSIDFFNNTDILWKGKAKASLSLYTLGSSITYFLPIIWTVVNSGNYNITKEKAVKLGRSIFDNNSAVKESIYYVGAQSYKILEGISDNVINDTFNLRVVNEKSKWGEDEDVRSELDKMNKIKVDASYHVNDSPEAKERYKQLNKEYVDIMHAVKGGSVKTIEELQLALKKNVTVTTVPNEVEKKGEEEIERFHEDSEMQFKKMNQYVKMVIKGINPSVILCGAPGVGKTYRVKRMLKAAGYHEGSADNGTKLLTVKGKMTPRQLYIALFDNQNKGNIVMIDDADSLVGPKAPEDSINILKAALDSTADDEGRMVSYGVSGKLQDNEGNDIPKSFYYNGSVIIVTNWPAGKLDTALKGRSYVQDLYFTVDDVLEIIKKLLPEMVSNNGLHQDSAENAYEYLNELSKRTDEMEISLRTFGICANIYEAARGDDDFTTDMVESMISEQMRLQASRGGKKY